jgi:phosphatidylserine decarboxylase
MSVDKTTERRVGRWLPSEHAHLERWIDEHIKNTAIEKRPLHPVIAEFKKLIEGDPQIFMLFSQMFAQVPHKAPYNKRPGGKSQVKDYLHMLELLNSVMTKAPEFSKDALVGCPINAILDWSMGTAGGYGAFLNKKVNRQLKAVLNAWGTFLKSKDSRYVLSDDAQHGWFGKDAQDAMPNFAEQFRCDPSEPHHGFDSWDDFFTRALNKGARPLASPDDDNVVANACESAPYRVSKNVNYSDKFWIKSQPYSLRHMLSDDDLAERFTGGTVYQAYLSALSYHRWHSPVSGRVVKAEVVDGTYYSESYNEGFDPGGPDESQGYLTQMATRARIYIEADNPAIGLMCFIAVGMAEVSTCDIRVYEGQKLKKGDQTGMFHFGGSTHCLIFGPDVKVNFDLHGQQSGHHAHNIPINSRIATIGK